jgi:GNAT superfamily N-acetyltransferase
LDIRKAVASDAPEICRVVRASITELCFADHKGDPRRLGPWLANKTPDDVLRWLTNPVNTVLVVEKDGAILAAGCVTVTGEVRLNYVAPAARFQGVSSALLAEMEAIAARQGHRLCTLVSTGTARRFYESRGFRDAADAAVGKFGLTTYPMSKPL